MRAHLSVSRTSSFYMISATTTQLIIIIIIRYIPHSKEWFHFQILDITRSKKLCNGVSKQYDPAGTQHQNDVVSTSMRRDHVASTLIRRHVNVVFRIKMIGIKALRIPLGYFSIRLTSNPHLLNFLIRSQIIRYSYTYKIHDSNGSISMFDTFHAPSVWWNINIKIRLCLLFQLQHTEYVTNKFTLCKPA